jgi:AraC-like DNA-binding protein
MPTLYLQFVPSLQRHSKLKGPGMLLMATPQTAPLAQEERLFSYSSQRLQPICWELEQLMDKGADQLTTQQPLPIAMEPALLQTLLCLGQVDEEAMLRLVLAYCLTLERKLCSSLLRFLVAADADLIEILYRYRLEPWPVTRYAELLGLSPRKFNQLFMEKFGVSAKHWLHQQRLEHAWRLLETSSKKIIDVAMESGFSNAAHFSDSFRRYFRQTPSGVRHGKHKQTSTLLTEG